jgi:hypothetical protein
LLETPELNAFAQLFSILNGFKVTKVPFNERELETKLMTYLASRGISAERQRTSRLGRYDVVVRLGKKKVCIELKKHGTTSCVEQLDRYARDFDGLILLCYKATAPLRTVFEQGKASAKIPIALVEVRRNCDLV